MMDRRVTLPHVRHVIGACYSIGFVRAATSCFLQKNAVPSRHEQHRYPQRVYHGASGRFPLCFGRFVAPAR